VGSWRIVGAVGRVETGRAMEREEGRWMREMVWLLKMVVQQSRWRARKGAE